MITVKEDTTLVGVSELRGGIDKILKKAGKGPVIIEKRHKPQAVLLFSEEYGRMQEALETVEDLVLGYLANERYKGASPGDYLDIETLLKE